MVDEGDRAETQVPRTRRNLPTMVLVLALARLATGCSEVGPSGGIGGVRDPSTPPMGRTILPIGRTVLPTRRWICTTSLCTCTIGWKGDGTTVVFGSCPDCSRQTMASDGAPAP